MEHQRKFYKNLVDQCNYLFDGKKVDVSQIKARTTNFGQPWRTENIQNSYYKISMPKQYVLDYLKRDYNDLLEMFITDDDECKLSIERELIKFDYPRDLDHVFSDYNKYRDLIHELLYWYGYELIDWWVGDEQENINCLYVLNTIDKAYLVKDLIFFEGKARSNDYRNIKYQDH